MVPSMDPRWIRIHNTATICTFFPSCQCIILAPFPHVKPQSQRYFPYHNPSSNYKINIFVLYCNDFWPQFSCCRPSAHLYSKLLFLFTCTFPLPSLPGVQGLFLFLPLDLYTFSFLFGNFF